jgi:predicted nucleic acid-binding protein
VSSEPGDAAARSLVLDANILVRAVLGQRVPALLRTYANGVHFLAPEHAYEEAATHLPQVLQRRGLGEEAILLQQEILERLPILVAPVPHEVYGDLEQDARKRLSGRDERDWPVLALALRLDCPIWTEDADFFGTGVPTWTTDRIELYLASEP